MVELLRKLDLDAFGLQEVCPGQVEYLTNNLPQYAFVGEHREADRVSGEASPVFYRRDRFDALKNGTFWLSETPDVPGVKGWGAACPRVCSWAWLKDRRTGKTFCFANAHTDHVSALARKEGMLLIIRRMHEFAPSGTPVVFTGDHNCRETEEPAEAVSKLLKNALSSARRRQQVHGARSTAGNGAMRKSRLRMLSSFRRTCATPERVRPTHRRARMAGTSGRTAARASTMYMCLMA